jgi:hypothetical protein
MDNNITTYEHILFNSYSNVASGILREQDTIVTRCLTEDCKDCTGSYTNEILGHRFICKCSCHHHYKDKQGVAAKVDSKSTEKESTKIK